MGKSRDVQEKPPNNKVIPKKKSKILIHLLQFPFRFADLFYEESLSAPACLGTSYLSLLLQ